ncbi:MAG TPA: hypothetical protein VGJ74_11850 [Burkholderiales bacterium]
MAKQVVFVVHGMGDFKDGWGAVYSKLLKELYERYEIAQFLPFEQQFEVKPLLYNDRFDKMRADWKAAADAVLGKLKPLGERGAQALATATQWAQSAGKNDFLRTHVLDVLFYRFIPQLAEAVRTSIRRQILEGMKGAETWSMIAHSLGTSVAHDSLVWMFDPASGESLPPEKFRLQALAMLANVSRVLESSENGASWDVYRSVVQPNVKLTKGVCNRFLNVRHTWDPVPLPKQFKPQPNWPDAATREVKESFQDIQIDDIEALGDPAIVHDLGHYLRNPAVHIPLFRSLIPLSAVISQDEEDQAIREHRKKTPLAQAKKKIEELKKFRLSDEEEDWNKILWMFHRFFS